MEEAISVGVIGVGGMGGTHARNLHAKVAGARLAAVMDADQTWAEAIAAACGSAQVFDDAHDLIHAEGIEAVLIASPDATHAGLVLECLRVNKPVLCEKPLATRVADAQKVIDAEMALGRKLVQLGFVRRFDNQHVALKREIESGTIGRPILYRGWHRNMGTGLYGVSSATFLIGSAIHDFDAARWMLGQEIEEVFVRGVNTKKELGEDVFDLLLLQLVLSGGCLATIEVYVAAGYGYEVGVEVVGERGTALIDISPGPAIRSNQTRLMRVEADWLERLAQGYVTELEVWIASIQNNTPAGPDAWDGYASLLAAESSIKALESGTPYRLPRVERPALYQ
jgi:myo-inositol 2-dehydrogenase/D-chiro-inositol 1-dehydrogenase